MTTDRLMELIEGPINSKAEELAATQFDRIWRDISNLTWGDIGGLHSPDEWIDVLRPALTQRVYRYLSLTLAEQAAGWETVIGKTLEDRK